MSDTITGMMHATETITADSWTGIKGDKGDAGSDASVTADNIKSALGYTPEKEIGNYRLIETVDLNEEAYDIYRNATPEGVAYNFKKIMAVVIFPKVDAKAQFYLRIGSRKGSGYMYGTAAGNTNYFRQFVGFAEIDNGCMRTYTSGCVIAYGSDMSSLVTDGAAMYINPVVIVSSDNSITYIQLRRAATSDVFPVGLRMSIYGIDA